jgi:cysteinyl-tRNA synthetase
MDFLSQELVKKNSPYILSKIVAQLKNLFGILGLLQRDPKDFLSFVREKFLAKSDLTEEIILKKIQERADFKKNKQFDLADEIRNQLSEKHIALQDTPSGTVWDVEL